MIEEEAIIVQLEDDSFARIDALARARGVTCEAMLVTVILAGLEIEAGPQEKETSCKSC